MLIVYYILLCMYASLCVLYLLAEEAPRTVPPWPVIMQDVSEASGEEVQCQGHEDCPSHHVCLGGKCVRKLLRGGQCNPETGYWISYHSKNTLSAVCACLNPALYGQKMFGGDCAVSVACGVHGKYDPIAKACQCDPGYKAVDLKCQKLPAMEYKNTFPCAPDEFQVDSTDLEREGFHAEYVADRLQGKARCVKRPCQFDALSGRPLKHGRYVADWGCVCDPRYGLFGVNLTGRYLKSEGFEACASIFHSEPARPINVQVITYFYLGDKEPISLLLFEHLKEGSLIPLLKGRAGQFMIRQSKWRYDYAQHFFNETKSFRARTRSAVEVPVPARFQSMVETIRREYDYKNAFEPIYCDFLHYQIVEKFSPLSLRMAYKVLYASPVCRIVWNDSQADPMFRDRVVVNPQQLTLTQHEDLEHFNAFVLRYDAVQFKRWTLDLDYAYEVDRFRSFPTNAPNYAVP